MDDFDTYKWSQNMILISACGGLKFLMFVHNSTVDKPVNSAIGQARPLSELTLFEQQSPYSHRVFKTSFVASSACSVFVNKLTKKAGKKNGKGKVTSVLPSPASPLP